VASTVSIIRDEPERVVVTVRAREPGIVVLADLFYPGWEATVAGSPAPIYRANYLFRGVPVPAGTSEVVFEYRPRSVRYGIALSLVTLTLLVGYVVVARRRAPAPARR
jgi:uncharacterized membrane protein YfhO